MKKRLETRDHPYRKIQNVSIIETNQRVEGLVKVKMITNTARLLIKPNSKNQQLKGNHLVRDPFSTS